MLPDLPLLPLVLLGALLALDVVSFPQAMISRPIVAATIGGLVVGDLTSGLMVGTVLELIALETLPVGASRYPEWGSASVVAGALFAGMAMPPAGALAVSVLGAIGVSWLGGWSMYALRRFNGRLARSRLESGKPITARIVVQLQLVGLTADFVRGAILTLVALLLVPPAAELVLSRWNTDIAFSRAVVIAVAIAIAAAASWRLFVSTRGGIALFASGLVISVLFLGLR
jgi:mannose/fructose/N-acetylgalactosamine-specific phosphotransferase system component IIC